MLIVIFFLGLAVGSFLNSYIWRTKPSSGLRTPFPKGRGEGEGKSPWQGRSYCPKCKKPLRWYELIPLLSFVLQVGRCQGCRQKIDWQYPLVELAAGILFVLAYFRLPTYLIIYVPHYLVVWYLLSVLIVLFVYDLRFGLVPDRVVLPAIIVAALYNILRFAVDGTPFFILNSSFLILAIVVGAGFFWLQYLISKGRWLGAGDIRIGALAGAMFSWPLVIEGIVISYLIGAVTAAVLLVSGKKRFGQTLPLGTFLTLGMAVVFLYGEKIWDWYMRV